MAANETPKLHHVEGGNPDGPPAVLIHGFLSSNHQWDLNVDRLGEHLRLVMVELPGHGASPPPATADGFTPSAVIAAIDRVRAELGIERWWVIGQSMGGAVAVHYVLARPQHTLGLVFTNSRAVFGVGRSQNPGDATLRAETPADLRKLPFHPIHARRFPDDLKERMVAVADRMDPLAVTRLAAGARSWEASSRLDELAVPALLVNGRWEKAFQPHVPTAEARIGDLRVVHLEGGHSINIEQPEAFDEAVLDFIAARG